MIGLYYNDTLSVSGLTPLANAPFAVGDIPGPLFVQGTRGIFGLGTRYAESLYRNPGSPYWNQHNKTYLPLWERLALASPSAQRQYSVWLNAQSAKSGTVQFGSEDKTKYTGRLIGVPLNVGSEGGDPMEWNVNLTSVTRTSIGRRKKEMTKQLTHRAYSISFTLDTGSPNMYVPTSLYDSIIDGLNATEIINGAPYVPCSLRSTESGSLVFGFKSHAGRQEVKIRVPYSDIVYPLGFPVTVSPVDDRNGERMCYFGVVPTDGEVRLLGATFLRSAYAVFDLEMREIRLAQAKHEI